MNRLNRHAREHAPTRPSRFEHGFRALALIVWLSLIIVLAILAYNEYTTGQRSVYLFADMISVTSDGGMSRLGGVMTIVSYSALLLAGFSAGLISFLRGQSPGTRRPMVCWGAAGSLCFLAALDERFAFHEEVGGWLGVNDALLLGLYPVAFIVLGFWGRREILRFRRNSWLLLFGALAAATSIAVDYVFVWDTRYAYLTLVEDGAKVFASLSLLLLMLKCLLDQLREAGASPEGTKSGVSMNG